MWGRETERERARGGRVPPNIENECVARSADIVVGRHKYINVWGTLVAH